MQNDLKNITQNGKYLPSFPYLASERSQRFFGLILTLFAIVFFGFFAIKPTVSTILKLQKELSDNQFVLDQMQTKIKNLSQLRGQYSNLENDMQFVTNAITVRPEAPVLFAQIQSIAQASGITIKKLQNFEIGILGNKIINKNYYSYSFAVTGSGSYINISSFLKNLTNMERVIVIDSFSINNIANQANGALDFDMKGTAFFKDNL